MLIVSGNFTAFCEDLFNYKIAESDILNGYTTFLMTNKQNRDNIKNYRMDWIINNYTGDDNKEDLENFYKNNINDTYSGLFNPPKCIFNEIEREERREEEIKRKECEEYYNDDVKIHYDILAIKFSTNKRKFDAIDNNDEEYFTEEDDISNEYYSDNTSIYDDYELDLYNNDYEDTDYYEDDDISVR